MAHRLYVRRNGRERVRHGAPVVTGFMLRYPEELKRIQAGECQVNPPGGHAPGSHGPGSPRRD